MSRCVAGKAPNGQAYFDEQVARVNEPTVAGRSRSTHRGQLDLLPRAMDEHGLLLTGRTVRGLPRRGILNNYHLALFARNDAPRNIPGLGMGTWSRWAQTRAHSGKTRSRSRWHGGAGIFGRQCSGPRRRHSTWTPPHRVHLLLSRTRSRRCPCRTGPACELKRGRRTDGRGRKVVNQCIPVGVASQVVGRH